MVGGQSPAGRVARERASPRVARYFNLQRRFKRDKQTLQLKVVAVDL